MVGIIIGAFLMFFAWMMGRAYQSRTDCPRCSDFDKMVEIDLIRGNQRCRFVGLGTMYPVDKEADELEIDFTRNELNSLIEEVEQNGQET